MKKIFGVIYLLIALFICSDAYSCKNDAECDILGQGFKCCFDASKAKRVCIFGCGCNDKNAPCPTGYRCCYDYGIAHHICKSTCCDGTTGECCDDKDCPNNQKCCSNVCYDPSDPNYSNNCDPGGG